MQTPPTPPAHIAPATNPDLSLLSEVVIESGGGAYSIHVRVPCSIAGTKSVHSVISMPSRRMTMFIPCDGPTTIDQVSDPETPAPIPQARKK